MMLKSVSRFTRQYSLMGLSLFIATSLIWLRLNRIFPETKQEMLTLKKNKRQAKLNPFKISV